LGTGIRGVASHDAPAPTLSEEIVTQHRPALRRPGSRVAAALLAAIVALGAAPLPAPAAMPDPLPVAPLGTVPAAPAANAVEVAADPASGPDEAVAMQPSTAYEQAMEHADDLFEF